MVESHQDFAATEKQISESLKLLQVHKKVDHDFIHPENAQHQPPNEAFTCSICHNVVLNPK